MVVWAEFELGRTGHKKVGGQAGRRQELESLGQLGGELGRQEQGRRRTTRGDSNVAGGAHTHTHTPTQAHTTATNFWSAVHSLVLGPRVATALGMGWYLA